MNANLEYLKELGEWRTCKDCKFYWAETIKALEGCGCCSVNPPVYDPDAGWIRPGVYATDKPCRFFCLEELEGDEE